MDKSGGLILHTRAARPGLNLRVEVEERVQAHTQLRLNLFAAAFQHMHRHMSLVAIL